MLHLISVGVFISSCRVLLADRVVQLAGHRFWSVLEPLDICGVAIQSGGCAGARGPFQAVRPVDVLRRVFNALSALLILATAGLLIVLGATIIALPVAFLGLPAGVPAGAHLIAFGLAWGSSSERVDARKAALGLSLSSASLFVWLVVGTGIVEANVAGTLVGRGMHFLVLLVGALVLLLSAALNIDYFRSALIAARPNYSPRHTTAGKAR